MEPGNSKASKQMLRVHEEPNVLISTKLLTYFNPRESCLSSVECRAILSLHLLEWPSAVPWHRIPVLRHPKAVGSCVTVDVWVVGDDTHLALADTVI